MCGHLIAAGFEVLAYDIDAGAQQRAAAAGATPAKSARACTSGAEVVITMLPAPPRWRRCCSGTAG